MHDPIAVDEQTAARLIGMTPRTLQEWRRTGTGPRYARISSRCVRYRIADLDTWTAERTHTSTAAESAA